MDRVGVALVVMAFLDVMGIYFVLDRERLARNFPPCAIDGCRATSRSVGALGVGGMIGGAVVLGVVLALAATGSR